MSFVIVSSYERCGVGYKVVCYDGCLYEEDSEGRTNEIGYCDECPREFCTGLVYPGRETEDKPD